MPARTLIAAGVVAMLCVGLAGNTQHVAARADDRLGQLTRAFAAFDARDMQGKRWTSATLRGRIVVLDFWATWCAPCLAEIPHLRRIRSEFGRDRAQVIGISLDSTDRRTLVSWLNRQRVDWPQVWDGRGYDSTLAEDFGVASLPTSIVVGADGRALALNLRGDRLYEAVATLVSERRP